MASCVELAPHGVCLKWHIIPYTALRMTRAWASTVPSESIHRPLLFSHFVVLLPGFKMYFILILYN